MANTNPTIYKTISLDAVKNRTMIALSDSKKIQANQIIANFIQHLKAKHS